MRLGSGIAPIGEMLRAGVNVGLGVDGSASKDSGHLMNEARQATLLQRGANVGDAMSARTALELATRGGAKALGRDDLGSIKLANAPTLQPSGRQNWHFLVPGIGWPDYCSLARCKLGIR